MDEKTKKEVEKLSVLLRQLGITQSKCAIILGRVVDIVKGSDNTEYGK